MSGWVTLWKQLGAERKSSRKLRTYDDFLIRADQSNEVLRWRLTLLLVLVYAIRVLFFDTDYALITMFVLLENTKQLIGTLDAENKLDYYASDWLSRHYVNAEGKGVFSGPLTRFLFNSDCLVEPPPEEYDSLVNRIVEFKMWYSFTKFLLVGFLLTWIPILRCSYTGPGMMLLCFIWDEATFSRAAREVLQRAALPGWRRIFAAHERF